MAESLPHPWDAFGRLQAATNSHVISAWTNASDEALTELLEELAAGVVPSNATAIEQRHRALTANRAKKYRHRATLEDQVVHHMRRQQQRPDQADLAGVRQLVALASASLPAEDRELLRDVLGNGMSYREAASRLAKPVGTLKARISRLRRRLRDGRVGERIRMALAAA
jgi:DNA-binding NarL/FixJ family response regulator